MAKKKVDVEEDDLESKLDAAAAEADDEPDDELGEADEPEEVEVEDASDKPAPQRIRRPVGRPRKKKRLEPGEEDRRFLSRSATLSEDGSPEAALFASKDMAAIWNHVINTAREQEMPIEAIAISTTRYGIGPIPSQAQDLSVINGDLVMGDEHTSPGEALVNYMIHVFHLPSAKGPKLYKSRFYYRTGTRNRIVAPIAELRLGSPDEVEAEIRARSQFAAQKIADDAVRGVTSRIRPPTQGYGAPQAFGQYPPQQLAQQMPGNFPQYPPYAQPYQPPPPLQGASPQLEEMRREMATLMGAMNERARLEGLVPPPAPPPVVQGPTAEEQAAKTAQVVAQVLVGMGFTPALAARLNNPALSAETVKASVADPLDVMDQMFERMEKFEKMQSRLRDRFAPEEEEEKPVVPALPAAGAVEVKVDKTQMKPIPLLKAFGKDVQWGERGEEESQMDYALRWFAHNPELGAQGIQWFLTRMSDSTVGKLIAQLVAQGLPNAAAAVQQQRQFPAPMANGAVAQVAQTPVATSTSSGFGAPKI